MTDLPTLEAALKLADHDSPLPSLAGPALKVLRNRIRQLAMQRLAAGRYAAEHVADQANDSATLTALIAELRSREAVGRGKYGTDVDRTDLTNLQWRQHLREELMDALLYSLAEGRTAPAPKSGWSKVSYDEAGGLSVTEIPESELYLCSWCAVCNPELVGVVMVLCPTCGNKRCPHAHDHRNACTGSNAVGQPGSSWEHVRPPTPTETIECGGCAPPVQGSMRIDIEGMQWSFQQRVSFWMDRCFGSVEALAPDATDPTERNHRFLEEALELVQSCGCTAVEAHQLVDYVFGRLIGEKHQEVGGVMLTLAALCTAQAIDMRQSGETELTRVWTKIEQIRAKHAAKPKHSPLPGSTPVYGIDQGAGDDKTVEAFGYRTESNGIVLIDLVESDHKTPNNSHGHVRPRPDGVKARCGGPAMCYACFQEQKNVEAHDRMTRLLHMPPASKDC